MEFQDFVKQIKELNEDLLILKLQTSVLNYLASKNENSRKDLKDSLFLLQVKLSNLTEKEMIKVEAAANILNTEN